MTANASPWSLKGSQFRLSCGNLSADCDLRDFDLGLTALNWSGSPFEDCILGPRLPQTINGQFAITDCYVRGDDFVVSCERPGPLPLVPQFYWRARRHEPQEAVSVELILSMRTDLLDSQPQTAVFSSLRCDEVLSSLRLDVDAFGAASPGKVQRADLSEGDVPAYLFRRPQRTGRMRVDADVSYFQMVHPDDFFATEYRSKRDREQLTTTLFPERLEKGVIRRARVCGWFLPAENDLAVAVELARQFVDEPLPLTA